MSPSSPAEEASDLKSLQREFESHLGYQSNYLIQTMFSCFKYLIPQPHGYMDEDKRYNLGLTWSDQDGLTDCHNLEFRYVRNSERLALQGQPMPDGSWQYVEANGTVHTITAERAKAFMDKTHEHATVMCAMLDKLREAGMMDNIIDANAEPA